MGGFCFLFFFYYSFLLPLLLLVCSSLTDRRIRLACYGGVWPISEIKRPIASVSIAGYDWHLHFGYNHGGKMKVFSFVPAGPNIHRFQADMKEFFDYLINYHGFPDKDQYLLSESRCPCLPGLVFYPT